MPSADVQVQLEEARHVMEVHLEVSVVIMSLLQERAHVFLHFGEQRHVLPPQVANRLERCIFKYDEVVLVILRRLVISRQHPPFIVSVYLFRVMDDSLDQVKDPPVGRRGPLVANGLLEVLREVEIR